MTSPIILVPMQMSDFMDANGPWGQFTTRHHVPEQMYSIVAAKGNDSEYVPFSASVPHFLDVADFTANGVWYTIDKDADLVGYLSIRQNAMMAFEEFRRIVPTARHPGDAAYIAITYCPEAQSLTSPYQLIRAWHISKFEVYPIDHDLLNVDNYAASLEPHWPGIAMANSRALVIGCGSIGGAAANSLASYGVGQISLLDPDRFRAHNVVRHILGPTDVGRFKVDALADQLQKNHPNVVVRPHSLDAIGNADMLWALMSDADIVICSVDGVSPRRVVSHMSRRIGQEAVLACVLADGRFGEIVRLQPFPDKGCLECQRADQQARGGMDLEPTLDRGYGEGTRHNPMTAVGADLHLVGALAAKVGVAGYLANAGDPRQYLAGDVAYIGLRPEVGWAAPFDISRVGEIRWERLPPPLSDCPTCHRD